MSEKSEKPADSQDSLDSLSFTLPAQASARGVIVTDAEHRVCFVDPRVCDLLGVDAVQIMGLTVADSMPALRFRFADPKQFDSRAEWMLSHADEIAEDVLELAAPDGRVLHCYSAPLLDGDGHSTGRIDVYSDITRRRHLEEMNAGLYRQIRSAYEELKATQDQLLQSEKLRAIGEIAAGVAHDFNNTLGIILGNIQLLLRTAQDEKTQNRLRAVEQAALDGAETIRRIQEFTRVQPDETTAPVDLSALAETVVEVMKPSWQNSAQANGCRIDVDLELAADVYAAGIAPEIREVLANVILNSVQAMPTGGKLSISTGHDEPTVWIRIADTGAGMSDAVRNRVFDPFFTTKGVEGSGLGMSVAYGIVKRHRGRITIESAEGEGTAVTIWLPVSQSAPGEQLPSAPKLERVGSVSILVVDDEEMFGKVLAEMLTEHGHTVRAANCGSEALDMFTKEHYDLVFTDLGMPDMSGWEVAAAIKECSHDTPVVLLTGWGAKVDEDRLSSSKVDLVLSKPVKMDELPAIVAAALAGRRRRK